MSEFIFSVMPFSAMSFRCFWTTSDKLLLLQPFNGLFSRTVWVSRYQKGKSSLDFTKARDDGVLGHFVHADPHYFYVSALVNIVCLRLTQSDSLQYSTIKHL